MCKVLMFLWFFISVLSFIFIYTTIISGDFCLESVERDTMLIIAIEDLCSIEYPGLFKVKGNEKIMEDLMLKDYWFHWTYR